ncbi:MAG: cation-transporting P-type ATPase, partial [Candidatus ainarchaeum sp.]|nr:cation-transporting P-type ATPase [Candidatus ainarchaeum sp.]
MPYSKTAEEVLREFQSSAQGISGREAELRLKAYGANEFGKGKQRNILDLVVGQFKNYLLILLAVAAVVAQLIGRRGDAIAIGMVVALNVIFGVLLEYNADRSMKELRKLAETRALVMREGKKELVDSRNLVPGDVILLEEGDKVPADARLLDEQGLEINESSLTGESMPVKKNVGKVAKGTPLAERSSMVFAGTFVARGRGSAVVVATGAGTEFGVVEKSLGEVREEETTLEKTLAELVKAITIASLAIVAVLFLAGLLFGKWETSDLFIYSVAVIVAAVPEGMLTVLTLVLAIGVKNMAREHALVRKLQAVETLGNVTFIATDKTGTITEGRMALLKMYDGKMRDFGELSGTERILSYAYLCNGAHLTEEGVVGDETDRALLIAGIAKGVDVRRFRWISRQIAFMPFDYSKKYMGGIYEIDGKEVAVVKGAPEHVLEMCSEFEGQGKLDGKMRAQVTAALESLAREGMRVIALAYGKPGKGIPQHGLTLLGFLGLHDPVRREVKHTIAVCRQAGIRVMMVTGDNAITARKIGDEIGLDRDKEVVSWSELENMDDDELDRALLKARVVARATPASKLRIVERLVKLGEIVAVTGDGVNDAPALKKAHVGVVMGRTGTAVSKEVADLVLTDDNFATLEKAIEYGRGITENIKRFLRFQVTTNLALVMLSVPYVLGVRMFEPVQILWINLIIDGPPALTLGLEKPGAEVMRVKPRKRTSFIDRDFIVETLNTAAYMAIISGLIYFYYNTVEPWKAITMVFCSFSLMQLANALNSRSRTGHFYSRILDNRWLVLALLAAAAVQLAIVTVAPLQELFGTVPLAAGDWVVAICAAISVLMVGEIKKTFIK